MICDQYYISLDVFLLLNDHIQNGSGVNSVNTKQFNRAASNHQKQPEEKQEQQKKEKKNRKVVKKQHRKKIGKKRNNRKNVLK